MMRIFLLSIMSSLLIANNLFAEDSKNNQQNLLLQILQQETQEIETLFEPEKLAHLHVSRGESYLVLGQDQKALDDFEIGYQCAQLVDPEKATGLVFRSFLGAFLIAIRAENLLATEALGNILLNALQSYACDGSQNPTILPQSLLTPFDSIHTIANHHPDWPILGPDQISIPDCLERVETTRAALMVLIAAVKNAQVRFLAINFINALADEASSCCWKGGLWKGCLQVLVNKLHYWKVLGIPSDPAWD